MHTIAQQGRSLQASLAAVLLIVYTTLPDHAAAKDVVCGNIVSGNITNGNIASGNGGQELLIHASHYCRDEAMALASWSSSLISASTRLAYPSLA